MDSWDEEEAQAAPVVPPIAPIASARWDDEDVDEDNVKASWDEDDDEVAPAPKPSAAKKKLSNSHKAAVRGEEEGQKKHASHASLQNQHDHEQSPETAEERRARLQREIVESDLQNAKDLFGGVDAPVVLPRSSCSIEATDPKKREEFDELRNELVKFVSKFEKRAPYAMFVEFLTRDLCASMDPVDIRRISTTLNALASERQKATKPAATKKKAAPKLSTSKGMRGDLDTTNYDNDLDEFDDFM
ncbi:hypothetical protein SeMB42_g01259 [Synchytrium endobioticum]|uniref:Eukaryotic translation initiation factor 3 subunit J n=1 Tax=Synchytrium endobioticum TaxID=286115 RepID=A0A507CRB5_9FUNG|nr:hypothetical protein SeLEV6574_g05960 [Synchytrium endobioticum]TPX52659.1 hypothetical protein SeMB42_g01259 [Synchytrium endobioticum]